MKWPKIKQLTISKLTINNMVSPLATYYKYLSLLLIMSLLIVNWSLSARALDNPEQKLAEVIEDYVITRYPDWIGLEIRVTFKHANKIFEDLRGVDEDADFEIVEVYKDFKPVGNVIFPIKVSAGGISKKLFIRARVEVFSKVVVAQKGIKRGEIITDEDLALEERDIAMLPQKYFEKLEQVVETEAKTTIPKESTIFEWMIKEIPLVHRGDEVSILVTAPDLVVKTKGMVLEDGYLDKKIKVKRVESNKTLEGILISPDEVEVKLK